jgi:hypothetical protein
MMRTPGALQAFIRRDGRRIRRAVVDHDDLRRHVLVLDRGHGRLQRAPSLKQWMTTATEPGMPGDCRGLRRQLAPFTTFVPKLPQADAFG